MHSAALVRLVALECVPSLHGSGADAPIGQNEPGSQASHTSLPASRWTVPAAQLAQAPMLAAGATVPGLHLVGMVLPVVAKEPMPVGVHWSALLRSVAFE